MSKHGKLKSEDWVLIALAVVLVLVLLRKRKPIENVTTNISFPDLQHPVSETDLLNLIGGRQGDTVVNF